AGNSSARHAVKHAECNPRVADRHQGEGMRKSGSVIDLKEVLVRASRRDFIKLAGVGGVVLVSGFGLRSYAAEGGGRGSASQLGSAAKKAGAEKAGDFYFVQLSGPHWGFGGPAVNPDAQGTLEKAVAPLNGLDV